MGGVSSGSLPQWRAGPALSVEDLGGTRQVGIFMIQVEIPGRGVLELSHAVFDFNGTLALDGALLPGVADDMARLSAVLSCVLVSADTHGTLARVGQGLGCPLHVVTRGEDKAILVEQLPGSVVAIGNGQNDWAMFQAAALSIAVLGPEGASGRTLAAADVVVRDVHDAFGLLLDPTRLVATLRM